LSNSIYDENSEFFPEIPLQRDLICRLMALNGNKDDFVFGGAKPMDPRTLQNHFKKILKEADRAKAKSALKKQEN
jgi:hypothetical protein